MEFRILGSLELVDGTRVVTPTAPKLRQLVAFLVVRRNQVVQAGELIREIWGEQPPHSALLTLQTYISKTRRILHDDPARATVLQTRHSGYVLEIANEDTDVSGYERLTAAGRAALAGGDSLQAAGALSEALALWRGPALHDVPAGALLSMHITRLEDDRLRTLELRAEADLRLGRHRQLISELKGQVELHPLHEGFHGKLMAALHRSGRRCEAVGLYPRLRAAMMAELGTEPSGELRLLHQELLAAAGDPDVRRPALASDKAPPLAAPDRPAAGPGRQARPSQPIPPATPATTALDTAALDTATPDTAPASRALLSAIPAQLPEHVADLLGRQAELARIEGRLSAQHQPGAVPIIAITGAPGTGKTALAIYAAHQVASGYPAGQLFAELGGSASRPARVQGVLDEFLRAIGVPPDLIPPELGERSKLFRSWSADRSLLMLLDDVASADQVTALLPGFEGCAVILTSRLPGLAVGRSVQLDGLSAGDGVDLLACAAGEERVQAELTAAESIVRACDGLPLAIRAAGARLAAEPGRPLWHLAGRLADVWHRLAELQVDGHGVQAACDANFAALGGQERAAAAALSRVPKGSFTSAEAAALLGCGAGAVDTILARLVAGHVLRVGRDDGHGPARYAFLALAHAYARTRLADDHAVTGLAGGRPLPALRDDDDPVAGSAAGG
jgi:DNA-binding SARP family transcriptional activator